MSDDVLVRLQDALLPRGVPVPPGVEIAARSLLAEEHARSGGDWFDAIALPDGRIVLVVGDVVGHGIDASVEASTLRALFEERVRADGDVVAALELLDVRARRVPEARSTTVCACVFDPASGVLTYCTAGHRPPVVVTPAGEASYLPVSGAAPLCSGVPFATAEHELAAGEVVLLYSDGLVERPERTPAQGTVDLLRAVTGSVRAGQDAAGEERVVDRVSRQTLRLLTRLTGYADDITLLAMQVVRPVLALELSLPAVPDTVRAVRAALDDWLAVLRIGALDRTAVRHAVGELVSNAVEHAYAEVDVRNAVTVDVRLCPDASVEIEVADGGAWREVAAGASGRGLALVSGFLDEFGLEHDEAGTRARGRYRVSHPAVLLRGTSVAPQPRPRNLRIGVSGDGVTVAGDLDPGSAAELRRALARASVGGVRPVTVDLTEVGLLCGAAVQAIYEAREAGTVDLVAPMGSPAQHVLDLVRLPYVS